MAVKAVVVTVAATATALNGAQNDWIAGNSCLISVPAAGQTVFVGGSDVTAATGYPWLAGTEHPVGLDDLSPGYRGTSTPEATTGEIIYGIVASGSQAVNVLSQGI
jgi:hypothetical protein